MRHVSSSSAKRWLPFCSVFVFGCQLVSGLSDLEVVATQAKDTSVTPEPEAGISTTVRPSDKDASVPSHSASSEMDGATVPTAADSLLATASAPSADASTRPIPSTHSSSMPEAGVPDAAPVCMPAAGAACDPVLDCGCDEGESCKYALSSGAELVATCGSGAGDVEPANLCDDAFDCGAGYYCHDGLCARACHSDEDCSPLGAHCLTEAGDAVVASDEQIAYCTHPCNPFEPNNPTNEERACGAEVTCVALRDQAGAIGGTTCVVQTGDKGAGEVCSAPEECAAGLDCVDDVCVQWCRIAQDDCPTLSDCVTQGSIGGTPIGQCGAITCEPTGGNACAVLPANCGCEGNDQCQVVSIDGTTSCLAIGASEQYGSCDGDTDCGFGLTCSFNTCRPYCSELNPCEEGECLDIWSNSTAQDAHYCPGACDPVDISRDGTDVTPCPEDAHCEPLPNAPALANACVPASGQDVAVGDKCGYSDDCVDGAGCVCDGALDCANNTMFGTCEQFCMDSSECGGTFAQCVQAGQAAGFCCGEPPTVTSECELHTNCGCQNGDRCYQVSGDGTTACLAPTDGVCSYSYECPVGTSCVETYENYAGTCRPDCDVNGYCGPDEGLCQLYAKLTEPGMSADVCMTRCDPVAPDTTDMVFTSCATGSCLRGAEDSSGSMCVITSGSDVFGDYCIADSECVPGYGCDTVVGTCAPLCRSIADCPVEAYDCDLDVVIGSGADATDVVGVCYY